MGGPSGIKREDTQVVRSPRIPARKESTSLSVSRLNEGEGITAASPAKTRPPVSGIPQLEDIGEMNTFQE